MAPLSSEFDFDDPQSVERFRALLANLAERARTLPREERHDVRNAIGAARNALELIAECKDDSERERFVEIARRNAERAERLLASSGDERNDLRGASEGDHRNAIGF